MTDEKKRLIVQRSYDVNNNDVSWQGRLDQKQTPNVKMDMSVANTLKQMGIDYDKEIIDSLNNIAGENQENTVKTK